jgi:hypothetical protein
MGKSAPTPEDFGTRKQWESALWEWLLDSLDHNSFGQLQHSLELVLTPYERRHCALRAAIMDRLSHGRSYKKIQRELWVRPSMISWVKKSIQAGEYQSSWSKTKVDILRNRTKRWRSKEKPLPDVYRNTKYGRMRAW